MSNDENNSNGMYYTFEASTQTELDEEIVPNKKYLSLPRDLNSQQRRS